MKLKSDDLTILHCVALLVGLSFAAFLWLQSGPAALVFVMSGVLLGYLRRLEPPVKRASEEDVQRLNEKLTAMQGQVNSMRIGLGMSGGKHRPSVSMFGPTKQEG